MVSALLNDDVVKARPLKRAEYDCLVADGMFEGERLELIRGVIVEMSPQDAKHAAAIQRISRLMFTRVADRAEVRVQLPLALSDDSEPEPDIAVVARGEYRDAHPTTALLVVEVAHSRLSFDRITKASLYAACNVPEYWIVNLIDARVEVHTKPAGGAYTQVMSYAAGDVVTSSALPGLEVAASELL